MTALEAVLVALVTYRLTMLVVADKITEPPRAWLQRRLTGIGVHELHDLWLRKPSVTWWAQCTCGELVEAPERTDAEALLDEHRRQATTPDSKLAYLLSCPWCVSPYVGAGVAWSGWCFAGRAWWFVPALTLAASAVTGIIASFAAPGSDD